MNFEECREKYAIYARSLDSKKSQLKEKEQEIEVICSEYEEASSIWVNAKEELEKSQNNLDSYTKKKFNNLGIKLLVMFATLSIVAESIVVYSSDKGLVYAVLLMPAVGLANTFIYGACHFIRNKKPEWIQRFWKKDKSFNELKELVKEKEKAFNIAEANKDRIYYKVNKCRKDIKILEEHILYIENDVKDLMMSIAPTIFSEEAYEQGKNNEKPYTRIKKPENQN